MMIVVFFKLYNKGEVVVWIMSDDIIVLYVNRRKSDGLFLDVFCDFVIFYY